TDSPRVPLEVAENIIDQLSDDVRTLRSCALTCRGWLPRSRYQLMSSIGIHSADDPASMYNYFRAHPRLTDAVRSVTVTRPPSHRRSPHLDSFPVLLLSLFPNLRSY
ncbi:hypothetical protein L226DRAFT_447118, partial [Lentinus tigrinus ALCF2SS1-7]|uniref:uncharacterized protein n=1 Tax=Lentinus tigrinus ALCF2SS1-7 TaxID=1328758 RepID=UPI001165D3A4